MFLNLNSLFVYSLFFANELAKVAPKGEFLVAKVEVSIALATILITISSPAPFYSSSQAGFHTSHLGDFLWS